jgi:hypothetical protein
MKLGAISAGSSLVVIACGVILGLVLIGSGNGINSNVSDSGGGIEYAVGFMFIGAGYLVIAGAVLLAAKILIVAAIAFLVIRLKTKNGSQSNEISAAGQQIRGPNPNGDSKESKRPGDD